MVFWMGSQPWLKVNLNGERFCNESGTYDFILHADASQPGNIHVCLWDADWQTYAQQFDMHGCSRMFPFDNGAAPNLPIEVVTAMNEEALKAGHIQQADTIEELAEKLVFLQKPSRKRWNETTRITTTSAMTTSARNHSGFPLYANLPSSAYVPQALCYAPWTAS